jgi:DNA-binding PadR family transcriptional regulator
MKSRSESLEFALLGLLKHAPLHGYELRKRLLTILGPFRALSFSVLYPQLHRMQVAGLIIESVAEDQLNPRKRPRIVYSLTAAGSDRFDQLVASQSQTLDKSGTAQVDDEQFEVWMAFFDRAPRANRLWILQLRRERLSERSKLLKAELKRLKAQSDSSIDRYLVEWRRHTLAAIDREIEWLDEMIKLEGTKQDEPGAS